MMSLNSSDVNAPLRPFWREWTCPSSPNVMWMRSSDEAPEASRNNAALTTSTSAVLVACAVLLIVLGVVPGAVIGTAEGFFDGLIQFASLR